MSEKVDKRKIPNLDHMKKMREALARKNEEKKQAKLNPPEIIEQKKVQTEEDPEEEEEDLEDLEPPVPVKKTRKVPYQEPNYDLEGKIRQIVENSLPPELRSENRKKQKWQLRTQEVKDEILQSLQPTASTKPSEEPQKNAKSALQNIDDLFW